METVNGVGYGKRKETRTSRQGPEEEFPEMDSLPADDPKEKERFEKRPHIPMLEVELGKKKGSAPDIGQHFSQFLRLSYHLRILSHFL